MRTTHTDTFSFTAVSTETTRNNFSTSITRCKRNDLYMPSVPLGMMKIERVVRQIVAAWLEAQSQDRSMTVNGNSNQSHQKKKQPTNQTKPNLKMRRA